MLLLFAISSVNAQNVNDTTNIKQSIPGKEPFQIKGSAGLTSDFNSTTNAPGLDSTRRQFMPKASLRGNMLLNISLYDQVQLPFELWFTTSQVGFQQPFNQFGVNPRVGDWLILHGGYFFTRISDLSFGDSRMLGGGVELTPGKFRFSALYGRIRDKRQPDSTVQYGGEFKRMAYAFKIGYGAEGDAFIHLNIAKSWDDTSSHLNYIYSPLPSDNLVTSLALGAPITSDIKLNAEGAISAYTDDARAAEITSSDVPDFIKGIFTPKYSSKIDAAVKAGLFVSLHRNFSFRVNTMWVGPGFQSLGYPNMPNDVFDVTFAPSLKFLNGDLSLRGSIGVRENNLRNNHVSSTSRLISSLDIFSQLTQEISINGQYSNYGMRTRMNLDTIHLQNISQVIAISPTAIYTWLGATNNVSFSYSFQDVSDENSYDTTSINSRSHSVSLNYTFLFESSLNLTTGIYYNKNESVFSSTIISLTETAGYAFWDKKLTTSATLGLTSITSPRADLQLIARATATYSMEKFGSFTLYLSNMNYMAGAGTSQTASVPSYNEMQGSLQYSIAF